MSTNTKFAAIVTVAILAAAAVVIGLAVAFSPPPQLPTGADGSPAVPVVVRDNTHILDAADDDRVTLVEFLDFECEACGAYHPYMDQIREDYERRVTFAFRYFPLPGHGNAINAALAVEAAAQQDQLEPMFSRMFETQAQWGERGSDSQADLFRTFAQDLGLDMAEFGAAVADQSTLERIELDFAEGRALGVDSTPTFFLNDQKLDSPTPDELRALIDAELAK